MADLPYSMARSSAVHCGCAGFAVLSALVTLHELSVANTAAGDASLATWGTLTELTQLNLDCTAVTNACAACTCAGFDCLLFSPHEVSEADTVHSVTCMEACRSKISLTRAK